MNIIKKHVGTNMQVISDGRAAYSKLQQAGYRHSVVVDKNEFVNSDGDHTNTIESIWSQFKNGINSMHGVKKESFDEYLKK